MAVGGDLVAGRVPCVCKTPGGSEASASSQDTAGPAKEVASSDSYECPQCEKRFSHTQVLQLDLCLHQPRLQRSGEETNCARALPGEAVTSPRPHLPQLRLQIPGEETNCAGALPGEAVTSPGAHLHHPRLQRSGEETNCAGALPGEAVTSTGALRPGTAAVRTGEDRLRLSPCQLPARRGVGLTKVRLEDCLRCDACSCIYLDQGDYDKHMRNFHRQNTAKKHRQKRSCRSCCRYCKCRADDGHHGVQKERGNNNLFHYNIKDRWTKMVSRRLHPDELKREMKPDPDDCSDGSPMSVDYSHLLSQVEVKIKLEPPDEHDSTV